MKRPLSSLSHTLEMRIHSSFCQTFFLLFLTISYEFCCISAKAASSANLTIAELSKIVLDPKKLLRQPSMRSLVEGYQTALETGKKNVQNDLKTPKLRIASNNIKCRKPIKAASEETAYTLGRYAAVAYCQSDQDIERWNCTGHCSHPSVKGLTNITVYHDTEFDLRYYIGVNLKKNWLVLAFRGTIGQPIKEFLDLLLFQVQYTELHPEFPKGAKIHYGFMLDYQLIRDRLLQSFEFYLKTFPTARKIMLTGHSLGGVMAELFALDLNGRVMVPAKNVQIFTYGTPRIGNAEFAAFVTGIGFESITRVTSNNDLIPLLPPRHISYVHYGQEMHLEGYYRNSLLLKTDSKWSFKKMKEQQGNLLKGCTSPTCVLEDPTCVLSHKGNWSVTSHLLAWDIVFGSWC